MFITLSAAAFATIIAQGVRPESDITLAAGYHRVKLSAYVAERISETLNQTSLAGEARKQTPSSSVHMEAK